MSTLRWFLAAAAVLGVLVVAPATAGVDRASDLVAQRAELNQAVLADVNAFRARRHLPLLRRSASLSAAAEAHSEEMAERGFFAHESADGGAFWKRIERFYASRGYRDWRVGENILWSSPDIGAQEALQLWLNSPPHRAILVSPKWREIGIAAVHIRSGVGQFAGREVTFVTTDFGVRRR